MINPFRKGILFGTVVSAIGAVLGIVAIFVLITAYTTAADTQKYFAKHLEELLDTVESTASVACYVEDKELAAELVAGLLKNNGIASVVVRASNKKELAHGGEVGLPNADATRGSVSHPASRLIKSPFDKDKVIGEIVIEPDVKEINRQVLEKVYFTISMLAMQLIFVAATVALILLYAVVRPIRALSHNLHNIDAAAGEKLPLPKGHEGNEIASLTADINNLAGTLVHALSVAEIANSAIREKSEQVANLLDNSGQGFMSFSGNLIVEPAFSRACEAMLGESPAGKDAADVFFHDDAEKADMFRMTTSAVLDESDPYIRESMLSLLPTEIVRTEALLKAEYKILDNGKFMVVLTDISEERRITAMLESERSRLEMIVTAVSDSRNFFDIIDAFKEFLAEGLPRILNSKIAAPIIARELYRHIHTFKGSLNQFGFQHTPKTLHDIESRLSELQSLGDKISRKNIAAIISQKNLQSTFDEDLAIIDDALGKEFLAHGESIVLSKEQARKLEKLATRLLRGETVDTSVTEIRAFLKEICTLRQVRFSDVLMGFDGLVRQAAERMEKEVAAIEVRGGADIWIDPHIYRPFLRSLVHVFRNTVAHGIETPEARLEAGKDEIGKIVCSVAVEADTIKLAIADDGAGINLEALRQRAVAAGICSPDDVADIPDSEVVMFVFMDDISTNQEVTELAGRGIGLAAVMSETRNLEGEVSVKTHTGQGTEFLFTLPYKSEAQGEMAQHVQLKPSAEVMQVMQSVITRARAYFDGEFGISLIESDGGSDVNSLPLLDMTAVISMGGAVNLLIAFSFDAGLINALYKRMTADFDVKTNEVSMFREAAAGDVINTVLGHCTADFQGLDRQAISLTPPVILDKVKHIHRMKNAMFYTQSLSTEFGRMNINLVQPRELFNTNLEYVK
jgi:signal transduction histidine kinase